MIDREEGLLIRSIPDASPLRPGLERGYAAEEATQDAASLWGLPDFVYHAAIRKVGSGTRELGDRILIVGGLGVVIQVKTREAETSDPAKERRWLEKQIEKGLAQAKGTVRSLRRHPAHMTNERGRTIYVDGNQFRWIAAVVIDHAGLPDDFEVPANAALPSVVLLRRDWEFLFDQLKSVHAVAGYLERVGLGPDALGDEPSRYYDLAMADEQATPGDLHPALAGQGRQYSGPLLPMLPVGFDDEEAHLVVRSIFEDVALSPAAEGKLSEEQRLKVLAELDSLPVGLRAEIGRFLLKALAEAANVPADGTQWRLRRLVSNDGGTHLAFGVASKVSPPHLDAFAAWVELRHHDLQQLIDEVEGLTTVGVLLTPRDDAGRQWDTTMVAAAGDLELTDEELAAYREFWSVTDKPENKALALDF